jgi:hypothetical protein
VDREGSRTAEEPFGRIVLQTDLNEVYTLDLYEGEGIVCRGFYLPPPPPSEDRFPRSEQVLPPEVPSEVELAAAADVRALVRESVVEFYEGDGGVRGYGLLDPEVSNYRFYVDMAAVSSARPQEEELWTGIVQGYGGALTFLLQRYGSPDIATMLILIFILIFFDRRASERAAECYRQAVEACGERRVKRYSAGSTLVNLQEMSFGHNCEWECK